MKTQMKNSEILIKARQVIEKPEHWTQESYARDNAGASLADGYATEAVCWCSLGAIEKVTGLDNWDSYEAVSFLTEAMVDVPRQSVEDFNDNHSHSDVLALFDQAITKATEQESAQ